MKVKNTIPDEAKKGVVYDIPRADCETMYIGETSHSLQMRMTKHKHAVNMQAVDAWTNQHRTKLPRPWKQNTT